MEGRCEGMEGGVIDELILTASICISQSDGLKLKEVADPS